MICIPLQKPATHFYYYLYEKHHPDRATEDGGSAQPGVASPIHFSETPIEYELPPPRLGQHTDEVLLEELQLDAAELQRLRTSGVIGG